ncbi:kinetochore Sim4 complex subunit FTA2-domain-containing protein [Chaetomium tenue]|uniref:Kinetochore Sim4 complex subunit FTA2-domain-containing protein n=1 Tax=Chaetomium tenue TaxID=1854479 RepID=A0ACB7NZX0_9PEZI|nr:kinetochore Sim4 complex subunit FTA2-domain-containing protein [Chaetomium globosum]
MSNLPDLLPRVPGPKLQPFTPTAHAPIQFIRALGNPGADSHVWEVIINNQPYALKMVMSASSQGPKKPASESFCPQLTSPHFYNGYIDPFNCECRAYGRLKEENREHLATPAHGYLLLRPDQELEITKLIVGPDHTPEEDARAQGGRIWNRHEEHRSLQIRAIVKDIAKGTDPFATADVPKMWSDLEALHAVGILVHDVHAYNYIGGKLIDFSRAWTTPHPGYVALDPDDVADEIVADPEGLNQAVEWGREQGWVDADVVVPEDLAKCAAGEGPNQYGTDPKLYNWLKWEGDPLVASKFIETQVVEL